MCNAVYKKLLANSMNYTESVIVTNAHQFAQEAGKDSFREVHDLDNLSGLIIHSRPIFKPENLIYAGLCVLFLSKYHLLKYYSTLLVPIFKINALLVTFGYSDTNSYFLDIKSCTDPLAPCDENGIHSSFPSFLHSADTIDKKKEKEREIGKRNGGRGKGTSVGLTDEQVRQDPTLFKRRVLDSLRLLFSHMDLSNVSSRQAEIFNYGTSQLEGDWLYQNRNVNKRVPGKLSFVDDPSAITHAVLLHKIKVLRGERKGRNRDGRRTSKTGRLGLKEDERSEFKK